MTEETINGRCTKSGDLIPMTGPTFRAHIGGIAHKFLINKDVNSTTGKPIHDVLDFKSGARLGSILNLICAIGPHGLYKDLTDVDKARIVVATVERQFGGADMLNKALLAQEMLNPSDKGIFK